MKNLFHAVKNNFTTIIAVIALFSLYIFLFGDFFDVGDSSVWYALCATFLTLYIYGKK